MDQTSLINLELRDAMILTWSAYLLCTLVILLGAAGAVYSIRFILRIHATRRWPSVEARLLLCGLERNLDGEEVLALRYTYDVGNNTYTGASLRPYCEARPAQAGPLLEILRSAKVVLVRYNPERPEEACLLSGACAEDWSAFFGALLFFCTGVLLMLTLHFLWFGTSDYAAALTVIG